MESLLVYPAILAVLAVLLAGFLYQGRPLRGEALDRFESLAKTIQGTVHTGTWFRPPSVRFDASGCRAEIRWTRTRRIDAGAYEESHVWLLLSVSGVPAGELKIWRRKRPWRLRVDRPWGCPIFLLGDGALDAEFAIRSRSIAERLFAPERRAEALTLVRALVGDDALTIRGGVLRTRFEVDRIRTSGLSGLASEVRKLTALLQAAAR